MSSLRNGHPPTNPVKRKRRNEDQRQPGSGTYEWNETRQRWVGRFDWGYVDGKRKRQALSTKTEKEMIARLAELRRKKEGGVTAPPERLTLGEFLERWLSDSVQGRLWEQTARGYRAIARNHIVPTLGRVQLAQLQPQDLQRLYAAKLRSGRIDKLGAGLAPRTVLRIHNVIHAALAQAEKWQMVPRNVADLVDPPRAPKYRTQTFNVEQARSFLEAARGRRLEALFLLVATTALREGEAFGLRWSDIDLESGWAYVQQAIGRVGGKRVAKGMKTDRGRRIRLIGPVVEALRTHRDQQAAERTLAGAAWREHGLVFPTRVGTPLHAGNFYRRDFKPLLAAHELPDIRFHDLRHSAASLLLAIDIHPKIVQELLGHSQIGVTLDTYSHVLPTLAAVGPEKLGELLGHQFGQQSAEKDEGTEVR